MERLTKRHDLINYFTDGWNLDAILLACLATSTLQAMFDDLQDGLD